MDCKMTDIIAIISSIIAIGYSIYSIITKSYIRQYKHRLTRAHREKQLKMSCQALHNAPPNRT